MRGLRLALGLDLLRLHAKQSGQEWMDVGGKLLFQGILILLPISIGLAILRSYFWDIDLLIRRTLVYATLIGMLALVYWGSVVMLQPVFAGLTGEARLSQPAALWLRASTVGWRTLWWSRQNCGWS